MAEHCCDHILFAYICLKGDISLGQLDCQHSLIDEFLCMVTGCAWGNRYMSLEVYTKVTLVQGQEDSPVMRCLSAQKSCDA